MKVNLGIEGQIFRGISLRATSKKDIEKLKQIDDVVSRGLVLKVASGGIRCGGPKGIDVWERHIYFVFADGKNTKFPWYKKKWYWPF